ncbi:vitellogenin-3-like [Bactrocera tryoni]|uniref:vitellogenin-3-like n=1 Tax=Bactrocera tryoni TaxID=59916 RepID=UPI001A9957DE|nr:vitellogenin-3-like [Bactrocera tryoni]
MSPLHVRVNMIALLFIAFAVATQAQGGLFGITDVGKSLKDIATGVSKDVTSYIPTPEGIFESSKNLLAGYPFEVASSAINTICSSALSSETIRPRVTPDLRKINFQLRTACNNYSYPLLKSNQIWRSPEFDPTKKVVILATGWTTTVNSSKTIDVLAKAYNCRGDVNFVAVDIANFVDTLYTWSALNTDEIGENLAEGIVLLTQVVPLENIHLIGHSLGAHIVGATGRYFNEKTGKFVPRITGLDPAKPCFNEGHVLSGLQRGDAKFIDIIHSNPGVLGKRDPMGDVDFYPGGLDPLPKGCLHVVCAHGRAWKYYAESVYPGNEMNFMGKRCTSQTRLLDNKCPGAEQPMGYAVSHELRGNYFLEVNEAAPFGKGGNTDKLAAQASCGLCPERRQSK